MPLQIPNLDDRRFDDLSAELQARLLSQLPELSQLAPGDPLYALIDLFAWLTETVIYRANRIPERQRRAFLNLLQIPMRPARPAQGIVCIDSTQAQLPALLNSESVFKAGQVTFSSEGELQATPLELRLRVKSRLDIAALTAEGISLAQLQQQYRVTHPSEISAFRPQTLIPGQDAISTVGTVDGWLYLGIALNKPKLIADRNSILLQLAGIVFNIGLAPQHEIDGDVATALPPRHLRVELAWWPDTTKTEAVTYLPLDIITDSSLGGRRTGVLRVRLPKITDRFTLPDSIDPQYAGFEDTPPEAPTDLAPGQLLFWLRMRNMDDDLQLGYLGINAVEVTGIGIVRNQILGKGTDQPNQTITLPHHDIEEDSIEIEVSDQNRFVRWQRVDHFASQNPSARIFTLDAVSGEIRFGNGIHGLRPPMNTVIRAAYYRYGGGSNGNLPMGAIKEIATGGETLKLRHELPTQGGVNRESIESAEQRIPAFLNHRDRAVTADDFARLALDNPIRPIARADAVPGFFPGTHLETIRRNLAGIVSIFILPPTDPMIGAAPRPSVGMINDLYTYLSARMLIGTELYVLSPQYQPLALTLSIEAIDPATEHQTFKAVEESLLHYLWPLPPYGPRGVGWPLKRAIEINELRTQASRVQGVEAVNGFRLFYQDLNTKQWIELSAQQKLPLAEYQLPQLTAISITSGETNPPPPRGLGLGSDSPNNTGGKRSIPVPVIPDIC